MRQGAGLLACAVALLTCMAQARADEIIYAELTAPTDRYPHGVFGDQVTVRELAQPANTAPDAPAWSLTI